MFRLISPNVKVAQIAGSAKLTQQQKRKANEAIAPFSSGVPHDKIPLNEMFAALKTVGIVAVQEDGTPWSGILAGQQGRANIELAVQGPGGLSLVDNADLVLTWYKHETGRYEVVVYVS